MSERAVTACFLLLVATVMTAYLCELALLLWRRWRPVEGGAGPWRRRVRVGVLVLGTVGSLCIAYGFLIEPTWVEVTHVRVPLARLAAGSPSIRIVQVSDLHVEASPRNEVELPVLVRAQRPDLIVFTGDALNSARGEERFLACMRELASIAPLYAVEGNWDVIQFQGSRILQRSAARVLEGESVDLVLHGVELTLAGLSYGEESTLPELLRRLPPNRPVVFLNHTPDPILELADAGIDLVLAGHTHGGQVRLPGYGALLTLARHGKRFEAGLYRERGTWLYVNRGLGMEGGLAPRVRFLARPEVTVLELVPTSSGPP